MFLVPILIIQLTVIDELLKATPPKKEEPLSSEELVKLGFWTLTRNQFVVTSAIDLGVQSIFDAFQNDDDSEVSYVGRYANLCNTYASAFKATLEDKRCKYLQEEKTGKWGDNKQSKDMDEASVQAATQLSSNVLQVISGKEYIWPPVYEQYLASLTKSNKFRAEMEANQAKE